MRRKRMAQTVYATHLLDACLAFGFLINAMGTGPRQWGGAASRRKEPRRGPVDLPVTAQLFEQVDREQRVAILASFALFDP